ncbi:MAG: KH domain-containing protein [Clostridia bacterium]|nr:KH domain-containing protein [Clostridia bacterium]
MEELLVTIARGLVKCPDQVTVSVDEPDLDGTIVYHLHVAADDMGRVIGKQGRIAKEIRTLMRSVANRNGQKIMVEID